VEEGQTEDKSERKTEKGAERRRGIESGGRDRRGTGRRDRKREPHIESHARRRLGEAEAVFSSKKSNNAILA